MALSYGLTNPAAGMISTSTPEPTPIGYKMYQSNNSYACQESNDFGLTWTDCTYDKFGNYNKYGLVYDPVNDKVVVINSYSPYNSTSTSGWYSYYATPVLNTTTQFTAGTLRTKSPQSSSSKNKYNAYGSVFDYGTNSIIGVRKDTYYDPHSYNYFINSDYLSPNTFASLSLPNRHGPAFNIVTGKNGINLEIQNVIDTGYQANVFRFVKNSSTSYTKDIIASISASTLSISDRSSVKAAYLKDVGFIVSYNMSRGQSGDYFFTLLIGFDGTVSGKKSWSRPSNLYKWAISSNNYYSDRVYFAFGTAVYYTTDGINWNTCSGTLPSDAAHDIILNADNNVAISLGSYDPWTNGYWAISTDGGNSFVKSAPIKMNPLRPEECSQNNAANSAILVPFYS